MNGFETSILNSSLLKRFVCWKVETTTEWVVVMVAPIMGWAMEIMAIRMESLIVVHSTLTTVIHNLQIAMMMLGVVVELTNLSSIKIRPVSKSLTFVFVTFPFVIVTLAICKLYCYDCVKKVHVSVSLELVISIYVIVFNLENFGIP